MTDAAVLTVGAATAGYGRLPVLHGVSFEARSGQIVCIVGPNGAGKTTLMRLVSGLIRPWSGSILLNGTRIGGLPAEQVVRLGVAHVPQERHVFPLMSVLENLRIGATPIRGRRTAEQIETAAERWMTRFPILGERRHQPAGLLSGGEQQLLVICRSLMSEPRFVLMDEPSLGLSPAATELCFALIRELCSGGVGVVMVEQDLTRVASLADGVYAMDVGALSKRGTDRSADRGDVSGAWFRAAPS